MDSLCDDQRAAILDAVKAWAAPRYGARISAVAPETVTIERASSTSNADYLVTLAILEGPAPLRVKVTVAPDGTLQVHE